MVLGDLRSCIHLVYPHLFNMVFEGRRVFARPVLTDSSPGFLFSFWDFGIVGNCLAGLSLFETRVSAWKVSISRLMTKGVPKGAKVGFGRFRRSLAVAVGERIGC